MGTYDKALSQLRKSPDALPWNERWALARQVAQEAATGKPGPVLHQITEVLARDPKWEVRQEVASALIHFSETDHGRLAAALGDDANAYVRQAVEAASVRRRKVARELDRVSKGSEYVEHQLQQLHNQFGSQAWKKARAACERYGELVTGSLVHDLRSILTHLKANGLMVIDEATKSGASSRTTARLSADLAFLERVVEDMAKFTQPLPVERRRERLCDVVYDSLAMAQENLKGAGYCLTPVSIRIDVPLALTAPIARHLIVLALANVLKNAYEAFSTNGKLRRGKIRVVARRHPDVVSIVVRDNGKGIVEGEVIGKTLFIPGRRNKSKLHSTGYGLPIARRNIVAHGGSLDIQSGEDKGTVITMTLPETEEP
jgi:signal transduction histidine kinase